MKNLKLLSALQESTVAGDNFCVDIDNDVYIGSSSTLYCVKNNSKQATPCAEFISEVEDSGSYIIDLEFLFESNSIFVASSSGDLYLYNIDEGEVSTVGFVETHLEALAWSPDQEFLILLTGAQTLILMTKEFDAITEKGLCTDEFGESKPINVGWGSKTTQFHGSEGKAAAHIKQKEPKQALPYDDHKPRISWRKDGEFFVTSNVDEAKGYRLLRIWSQDAILQFTSELVEGLEEPVSWRPLGNVIACSQQCPNKHKIIFFEKNGLQHGEFALPFEPNTFKVSSLSWNSDSTVLLVIAEELSNNPSSCQVMLWRSSNYHWFLKQKFVMTVSSPYKSLIAKWNSFQANELQCYNQSTKEFYSFKWTWSVYHGSVNNGCDDSIVASIDNDKLLISPFGKLVVPPPLCAYMFYLTSSVQSVFFAPHIPAFAAYLEDSKIMIFKKEDSDLPTPEGCSLKLVAAGGNGFKSQVQPYSFQGCYNIKLDNDHTSIFGLCHWTWTSESILCIGCCYQSNQNSKYCIISLNIPSDSLQSNCNLQGRVLTELDTSVIGMCTNENGKVVAVQLDDGRVFQIHADSFQNSGLHKNSELLRPWFLDSSKNLILPQLCTNMSVITINGQIYFFGLSEKYNLYCNDHIILQNCTSYYIHDEFILATTIDHVLKCFSKITDLPDVILKNNPLPSKVQGQKIEKGARIVIAPSKATSVILQMPRGNLETIHPRALVLSAICKYLDDLQFDKATDLAKRHRIDMNLLYDHNPQQFLDNIDKVIEQVGSASDLNLLLASLKNEDVRATMYPLTFRESIQESSLPSVNKVNVICDAFKNAIDARNNNKYYHTLLAAYVKKEPSELDQALIRVKALKDSDDLKSTRDAVDRALSFLLYLVDIKDLRNTALGTYDLEIAVMIEQKSQADPTEFLSYYNTLQQYDENYRKFVIDCDQNKHHKALLHISKCGDKFSECLQFIKKHRLYTDALYLYPSSSLEFKVIWDEYGNYLMSKRYYDEAGVVFTRSGNHKEALLAYKEGMNWRMALCSASLLNYEEYQISSLCRELATKLQSSMKYLDAAHLLEHYVKNYEESIETLIGGCEWDMALLLMSKYKRHDLAETNLIPQLKAYHDYAWSYLEEKFEEFSKHSKRLKVVRTKKKVESTELSSTKFAEEDLFSDVGSVTDAASASAASSQISGSIMTRKSSKSRRKQKLKKYRLKEGSADEDLALIAKLSEIVTCIDQLKDNFLNTLKALVHFGFDEMAKGLQKQMCKVISVVQTEIPVIWNPLEQTTAQPEMKFGPDSTVNSITASLQSENQAPSSRKLDPELAAPAWRDMDLTLKMFDL